MEAAGSIAFTATVILGFVAAGAPPKPTVSSVWNSVAASRHPYRR